MATKQGTIVYLVEQLADAGPITARKMFGEYGVYRGDVMFALVCDDELYVKVTPGGRALLPDGELRPPYPGAKPCLWVPGDRWDDREWLAALAKLTASELPAAATRPKVVRGVQPSKDTARRQRKQHGALRKEPPARKVAPKKVARTKR